MTLIKIHQKNGHPATADSPEYSFGDFMNEFLYDNYQERSFHSVPRANISEDTKSLHLNIAIPGIDKSNIKIAVENEILEVSCALESNTNKLFYSRKEFDYSNFKRSFTIPEIVDQKKIAASYENGILNIRLPKKDEAVDHGPKEIRIS